MSILEITELLAKNELPELIVQTEQELNGWQKKDINVIHDKITLLLMFYLHNHSVNKAMILLTTFNMVFFKDKILTPSEHKIKLLMLCSFLQSLMKTHCDIYIKEKYLEELISLNKDADNFKVNFYIRRSRALLYLEKEKYKESEAILLKMSQDYVMNTSLLYDIYLCLIEVYEGSENHDYKHETMLNAIPLICLIYKTYNMQIYSLLFFINIYISDKLYDSAQNLCDLCEQILEYHFKDIKLLKERDEYYFRVGEKKMKIFLGKEKHLDVLLNIDDYINSLWICEKMKISFYDIKMESLIVTNKIVKALKIYNIIERYILSVYGELSVSMIKHTLNKLYIACSLADIKMYNQTLNKIYIIQKTISGSLLLSFNKIYIIKQNSSELINTFKDSTLQVNQVCFCGKVNLTREPFTICNKCKSVYYCSKECKRKYKKIHAKKCICI